MSGLNSIADQTTHGKRITVYHIRGEMALLQISRKQRHEGGTTPAGIASPSQCFGHYATDSVLEFTNNIAVSSVAKVLEQCHVNVLGDEMD